MPKLYTIGHSNHSLNEFLAVLKAYEITHLVDIRSIPKSRHVPWSNEKPLQNALDKINIAYTHLEKLGGLRHTHRDSINQGWINASFRGFADYMQTPEFYQGFKQLRQFIRRKQRVVIMCAEAVPWRCHRSMIGDAAIIRGISVIDIMSLTATRQHKLTPFAVVDKSKRPIKIYYPSLDR